MSSNKKDNTKKNITIIFIIILISPFISFMAYKKIAPNGKDIYIKPWGKVIDPDDQAFNPLKFRFEDYGKREGIKRDKFGFCPIIKKVIKPDMTLEMVQQIMDNARAPLLFEREDNIEYINPKLFYGLWYYINNSLSTFSSTKTFIFIYDENRTITKVRCGGYSGGLAWTVIEKNYWMKKEK